VIDGLINEIEDGGIVYSFARQKGRVYHDLMSYIDSLQERIDIPSDELLQQKQQEFVEGEEEEAKLTRLFVKGQVKESLFDEMKREIDERKSVLRGEITGFWCNYTITTDQRYLHFCG
jgi:site-specific DNA recombinase